MITPSGNYESKFIQHLVPATSDYMHFLEFVKTREVALTW